METERKALFVRLDPDTSRRLEDFRWVNRIKVTDLITAAINEYIERRTPAAGIPTQPEQVSN